MLFELNISTFDLFEHLFDFAMMLALTFCYREVTSIVNEIVKLWLNGDPNYKEICIMFGFELDFGIFYVQKYSLKN